MLMWREIAKIPGNCQYPLGIRWPSRGRSTQTDVLGCAAVSIAQLEYFVAVAEEGHLTRAAARLHISQPPLTRAVHKLEAELGVPLFERTARGMQLLPAGQRLLARAREILALLERTRRETTTQLAPEGQSSPSR
jgi:molybdenum-dependent DNA-binding transcriptional regulator ModE